MTDLLLGLDIGTTATKCVAVDPGRGVVAEDSRPVTLATGQASWAEEDPATWWRNACELIPAVLRVAGAGGGDVRGLGVAGMVPALLCLDEAGRPLRPSADGDVVVELGGAGNILVRSAEPIVDDRLFLDYRLVPGAWVPNGCMAATGSLVRWF
jgi:FGGY family of carbohydrate kinases, N-terminal domain